MVDDRRDHIDFSPLDPTKNRARFDGIVGEIQRRAAPKLAARRANLSVLAELQSWRRPLLAAAAMLAIACVGVFARVRVPEPEGSAGGVAEAIGVPPQLADWIRSDELPSVAELLVALEETP